MRFCFHGLVDGEALEIEAVQCTGSAKLAFTVRSPPPEVVSFRWGMAEDDAHEHNMQITVEHLRQILAAVDAVYLE